MNKNIIMYLAEYGNETFEQRPFGTLDALALCQFCYFKFDKLMEQTSERTISIKELDSHPDKESLFLDNKNQKDNRALFEGMLNSARFGLLKVCYYINRIDIPEETQFAAVTFLLPGVQPFIAFRGTDENIVGWQEDFLMFLDKPIPGQKLSVRYINDVSNRIGSNFMIGGHSKGGNLAVYSAMNCQEKIQNRISRIYTFDGPGFRDEILEEYHFELIKDKVISIIPKSSLVGMMIGCYEDSLVVESKSMGVLQHNPFSWVIEEGKLAETHLTEQHKVLLKSMNDWVIAMDPQEVERLVIIIQKALARTEAETTLDFSKEKLRALSNVIKNSKDVSESTKSFLTKVIKSLIEITYGNIKNEITKEIDKLRGK